MCVCVCVCVCEKKRERERERDHILPKVSRDQDTDTERDYTLQRRSPILETVQETCQFSYLFSNILLIYLFTGQIQTQKNAGTHTASLSRADFALAAILLVSLQNGTYVAIVLSIMIII